METTVGKIGEVALIETLRKQLPQGRDVRVGVGDDCAVVKCPGKTDDLVLKSDPVTEGRHFLKGEKPRRIGHKAVGRVFSDFAAMGATPRWLLVNLVLTPATPVKTVQGIYRGMVSLAKRYGCAIIGGDTSQGNEMAVHVFGVGTVPRGKARRRSGAAIGDGVYVTGTLGGSIRGKHLDFEPRVKEGAFLRTWANATIDISDGLASELRHIATESRMVIEVESPTLPLSKGCTVASALYDGEDFELLFTVPRQRRARFESAWNKAFPSVPCTRIGTVAGRGKGGKGIVLVDGDELKGKGFEHF